MKTVTEAHLQSWRESVPPLLDVADGGAWPTGGRLIKCTFGNPVPKGPAITERYILINAQATIPA